MQTIPDQNKSVTMVELQMSFARGWDEVIKISIPPAIWQQLTNRVHDKTLDLIGEPQAIWRQMAFDFGVEVARKYENPELAP